MFLRNEWYVVALSKELNTQPIQRWILSEPLALFRTQSGRPVAMMDRCPHRGAPLSMGRVQGETIAATTASALMRWVNVWTSPVRISSHPKPASKAIR